MPSEKKKATKETTAKKTSTKKTISKKTATKKPSAKGTTPKKTTVKKTTTKKPPAKVATAKKNTVKKTTPVKTAATKKPTEKKPTEKPKSNFLLPKIDINNIINNTTSLPLIIRTGISGFPLETTYFDTEMCSKGFYCLVHNNGKYFLLLPKWNEKVINEMQTGNHVVITRGSHEGHKNSFEIMFDDNSDTPFSVILRDEQITRLSPLKEGWNGTFYVYSGDIDECKLIFYNVYYRISDNLPSLQPVDEEIGKLKGLTPLSHDEAITALKAGERLVNGKDNYDIAHYHLFGNEILKSDSYYDLHGEGEKIPEDKLPQLYRRNEGMFGSITDHVRAVLKPLLESGDFPLLNKRLGLENLTNQLVKKCVIGTKENKNVNKINFEIILTQLENSLK
jgi:hypothetical protein